MKKTVVEKSRTNRCFQLYPIRIVPFDIGYKIDIKRKQLIVDLISSLDFEVKNGVRLFGEDAELGVMCSENLYLYIFADGIGVFSYQDDVKEFTSINDLDTQTILNERKDAHRNILCSHHLISPVINEIVDKLRSLVKTKNRRRTSYNNWESNGLSYVMSFYLLNGEYELIKSPVVKEWLGNLLFTDKHTYFGSVNKYFEREKTEQILNNIDVLSNIHVCHSWSTMVALGELTQEHRQYYIELEIVLQHIWMYAYITEQNIDFFLAESDKKVSSQQLTEFYDTLIDMTLIVKKYDTIINSRVHEREFRIFEALKESSKLEVLKKGIDEKSRILESKLTWAVDQKRLRSDRNTELFIIILTVLQVLSGFGLGFNDLTKPYFWISAVVFLAVFIPYRMRD